MIHLGDITKINGAEAPVVDVITGENLKYKVYVYEFPNGKRYVGMTKLSIQKRKDCGYQHNKPLTDAIKFYGWGRVKKTVVKSGLSRDEAGEIEKAVIHRLDTANPDNGYNVSFGGIKTFEGLHHTEEHKDYMRKKLKGREFAETHLEHLRKAHAKERKVVKSVDPKDLSEKYYDSLGAAANAVGGYKSNISRACEISGKLYKGLYWEKVVVKG